VRARFAFAVVAVLTMTCAASADGVGDCERHLVQTARKQGWTIRSFVIDRGPSLVVNRYDDQVGSQRVATEYMGFARLAEASGSRRAAFVCLHAGEGRGAVYVGVLPR
jgi:hypothetical protein